MLYPGISQYKYKYSDWIPGHLIKEHYKREELLDWSS